jgi:hypothetical protein
MFYPISMVEVGGLGFIPSFIGIFGLGVHQSHNVENPFCYLDSK